jgi:hypothetical protein
MPTLISQRTAAWTVVAAASMTGALALPAHAAAPNRQEYLAGQACAFPLAVDSTDNPNRVFKEFKDAKGRTVRTISAGRGSTLTFTNLATGAALTLKSNGAVLKKIFNPDDSYTAESTGHNVIILFPTDRPAGPTTTLYTGRVVYSSTATNDFTILSTSGRTRDICAELD